MYSDKHRASDCRRDIGDNLALIDTFIAEHAKDAIEADPVRHAALERWLQRLCEAAYRLGDRATLLMPGHPRPKIRSLGNRLRHGYDQVDFDVIWGTVFTELPRLKIDTLAALERLQSEDPA